MNDRILIMRQLSFIKRLKICTDDQTSLLRHNLTNIIYLLQDVTNKFIIRSVVERVWDIDGYPNYFFGADNQLYRFDSRGRLYQNKRIVIGYTTGYVLKSKFFSLAKLRPMLRRHEPTNHPADS